MTAATSFPGVPGRAPPTFYYPDTPDLPLPPGHRFPAEKYRLLRQRVQTEGVLGLARLAPSPPASRETLTCVHDAGYVDSVLAGRMPAEMQRRIGVPWSPILVARSLATVGGAIAAAREALRAGISGQLAGGTHHAHRDFGSGFCVFNDLAIATTVLLAEGEVRRVAILDLDVHHGDGTAAILAPEPRALVVSLHGERNFPVRKPPSDLDIALPDGTDDATYLGHLETALAAVTAFRPDLVLYLSGADPLAEDRLGRLALTLQGLKARDRRVLELARGQGWPVAIAIGGGYAEPIALSVEAYVNTFRAAQEVFEL